MEHVITTTVAPFPFCLYEMPPTPQEFRLLEYKALLVLQAIY